MPKRGQITVFLILAIVLIIAFGLVYYVNKAGVKKESTGSVKKETTKEAESADIVKAYVESCIKKVSREALFEKIGKHGGYLDQEGYEKTSFSGDSVPYYTTPTNIPSPEIIGRNLGSYILSEFEKCFDTKIFEDIGIEITKPKPENIKIDVGINQEDVSVMLNYPLTLKTEKAEANLNSFTVTLPIRLKVLYESAKRLVEMAKDVQPITYDISSDCNVYDTNQLTNVNLRISDDGSGKIIQLVDYSTYLNNWVLTPDAYFFQFAVKNVNIEGNCTG